MSILYCDCSYGFSCEMFLGALINAGMPLDYLNEKIREINLLDNNTVAVMSINKENYPAVFFTWNHDASLNGLTSENKEYGQNKYFEFKNLIKIIHSSNLKANIKLKSIDILSLMAEAESNFRNSSKEKLNFFELGLVDSIFNIVGAIIGLDYFNIGTVYTSEISLNFDCKIGNEGRFNISDQVALELLKNKKAPIRISPIAFDKITPDGAAFLARVAIFKQPAMKLIKIGTGAHSISQGETAMQRILIGEDNDSNTTIIEIETNVDDMNPQIYGYVMEKLFVNGALEVYFTPIYMKKNRPGTKITVIGRKEDEEKICNTLLRETTTLGVKVKLIQGHAGSHQNAKIMTRYGEVPVKLKILDGKVIQVTPEYDTCVDLAKNMDIELRNVLQEVIAVGNKKYSVSL
ncbi:MAG: DUF111 family protein [Anaerolineaceae bacterium]|nr:MAG: DUF111 family protein [Anaerolineaceae bacterium]